MRPRAGRSELKVRVLEKRRSDQYLQSIPDAASQKASLLLGYKAQ